MSNATKPDALEMLRLAIIGSPIDSHDGVAPLWAAYKTLEAERRENAERDAKIRELLRRLPHAAQSGTLGQAIALLDGGAK